MFLEREIEPTHIVESIRSSFFETIPVKDKLNSSNEDSLLCSMTLNPLKNIIFG